MQIGRRDRQHLSGFTRQFIFVLAHFFKHCLEPRSTKESKHHLDAKVGLGGFNPVTTEKPCEISGRWIGRIQLSERRDEQENPGTSHGLDIPYRLSGMLRDIPSMGWLLVKRAERLFFDIHEDSQHVVRGFYGLKVGLKPSLPDDPIDGFFTEIDVRQFQLSGAVARVV